MLYTNDDTDYRFLNVRREVENAYQKIDPVFRDTPQFDSQIFGEEIDGIVTLKIETISPVGCFKGRGTDYLFHKRFQEFRSGVVAASAGNFGQGLAYAARKFKTKCTIFAALGANSLKIAKIKGFGARVILHGQDFDEAKNEAKNWALSQGISFIEDGREPEITTGAATIAFELLNGGQTYDILLIPLGNGSLLNGMAKLTKVISPSTKVIGVCADGASAMAQSFQSKNCVETAEVNTIADGIAVRTPVQEALPDLFEFVDDVVLVTDDQIKMAMRIIFDVHRLLIEPAGVVGLAALQRHRERFRNKRVALPLCGANLTSEQIRDWIV